MTLFAETIVKRPICPTLIHDDATRIVVIVLGLAACLYVTYRAMRYFDGL